MTSLIASYLKMQSQGTRLAPSVPPARPRARACGRRVRLHHDGRSSAESSNGNVSAWRGEQELRPRQHPSEEQSWSGLRSGSTLSAFVPARLGADLRQWELLHAAVALTRTASAASLPSRGAWTASIRTPAGLELGAAPIRVAAALSDSDGVRQQATPCVQILCVADPRYRVSSYVPRDNLL